MRVLFPRARRVCACATPSQAPDKLIGARPRYQGCARTSRSAAPVSPSEKLCGCGVGSAARRFADPITATVGEEHGERVRHGSRRRNQAGTRARRPHMPAGTFLDQAHNAIAGVFRHERIPLPVGAKPRSHWLEHLYNLIPYQRRAKTRSCVGWKWKLPRADFGLDAQPANPDLRRYRYAPIRRPLIRGNVLRAAPVPRAQSSASSGVSAPGRPEGYRRAGAVSPLRAAAGAEATTSSDW